MDKEERRKMIKKKMNERKKGKRRKKIKIFFIFLPFHFKKKTLETEI